MLLQRKYKMNKTINECPIGIFDSGMGGLTVLKALKTQLPQESFYYLGDTARLPYGTKSRDTVIQYALQNAKILIDKGVKLLVIACNTASAVALPALQAAYPNIPIVGVIKPGASAAVQASRSGKVLVMATETTIKTGGYQKAISSINPEIEVATKSCSTLVALAEEGWADNEVARAAIKMYLLPSQDHKNDFDCVVLGCTHFPVFRKVMGEILLENVQIVDSAHVTAVEVKSLLEQMALMRSANERKNPMVKYMVTDLPERFIRVGEIFLGEVISPSAVDLIDNYIPHSSDTSKNYLSKVNGFSMNK